MRAIASLEYEREKPVDFANLKRKSHVEHE